MPEAILNLEIEGASEEELSRGLKAAQDVFIAAGVTPYEAALAHLRRETIGNDLTEVEWQRAALWSAADRVSVATACATWENPPLTGGLTLVHDERGYREAKKTLWKLHEALILAR